MCVQVQSHTVTYIKVLRGKIIFFTSPENAYKKEVDHIAIHSSSSGGMVLVLFG
jgi:hypothetical protein